MPDAVRSRPNRSRIWRALRYALACLVAGLLYLVFPVLPQSLAFEDDTLLVVRPGPDRPMYTEDGRAIVEPSGRAWIKRGKPVAAPGVLVFRVAGRSRLSSPWGGSHWPRLRGSSKKSIVPARGLSIRSELTDHEGRVGIAPQRGLALGSWSPFGGGSSGPLLAAVVYAPGSSLRVAWPRYEEPLDDAVNVGGPPRQPIHRVKPSFALLSPFQTDSCDFLRTWWEHETPSGQTVRALAVRDIQTFALEVEEAKAKRDLLELAYRIERAALDDASLEALTRSIYDTLEPYNIQTANQPAYCNG